MKIAFLVYHNVLDERVEEYLKSSNLDNFVKWEDVTGKTTHGAPGHFGTRAFPGYDSVRMIPVEDEEKLSGLTKLVQDFNAQVLKKEDEMRLYLLPLEKIV